MAADYKPLSSVPVVPAFEIIASVAEASPGPDGSYSYETPVSELLPWVRQATADGLYVVLDLQPGRSSLLGQAEYYQSLLELPDVGLALDAEWKLQPGQRPLQADRPRRHQRGQQRRQLARGADRAARPAAEAPRAAPVPARDAHPASGTSTPATTTSSIVIHMDGQGTPGVKQDTWDAVTAAAPPGVFFGWKDFLVKDHPTLTPGETMEESPTPVMISYQ